MSPPGPAAGYAGKRQALIDELRFVPVPIPSPVWMDCSAASSSSPTCSPQRATQRLANQPNVKQGLVNSPNSSNMIFNTKGGVLSDPRLRRAIRYAIIPSDMLTAAFGAPPMWHLEGSIYPKGTAWYDPATPDYNVYDPDKAKALMKEAGYDGKPIRFLVTKQYDYMFKIGQVAQAQLAEVGLHCRRAGHGLGDAAAETHGSKSVGGFHRSPQPGGRPDVDHHREPELSRAGGISRQARRARCLRR